MADPPIITDAEWEVLRQQARTAARRETARWPGHIVTEDDLVSDVMESLLASAPYTRKLIDLGPGSVRRVIAEATRRRAHAAAEQYRDFHGAFLYDAHRVRRLLEAGLLDADHVTVTDADAALPLGSEEAADLRAAVALLNDTHRTALHHRYRASGEVTPVQVHRAIAALVYTMNNLSEERTRLGHTARSGASQA